MERERRGERGEERKKRGERWKEEGERREKRVMWLTVSQQGFLT